MTEGGERIVVLGLGYVGLPLAVALARKFDVTGLDVDLQRIQELKAGHDRTREVPAESLTESTISFTSDPDDCRGADIYIITAPTPVNGHNRPDLTSLITATARPERCSTRSGGRRSSLRAPSTLA